MWRPCTCRGISSKVNRLIKDEEKGVWGYGGGGRGRLLYLLLYCHHQNDSCIKMGSDERRFNVLLIVEDKVTRNVHRPKHFWRERRAKVESSRGPSTYEPNALTLGQTSSQLAASFVFALLQALACLTLWLCKHQSHLKPDDVKQSEILYNLFVKSQTCEPYNVNSLNFLQSLWKVTIPAIPL